MSAIEKLVIKGFKAFPKEFELTLEGKHLLLYGENGSGKSSIYYALHCLYQSPLKDDAGKKYFNRTDEHGNPNNQHLINLNIDDDDSEISLHFEAPHPFIYKIDKDGYNSELLGGIMPLPGFIEGCFINHKFIFNFFHFHNSEYINLFPVFEKDILPYCNIGHKDGNICLGQFYERIIVDIQKKGNRINKHHYDKIDFFNNSLLKVIGDMNLHISDLYNNYFRYDTDKELQITLHYPEIPDSKALNGYRLKYDYLQFLAFENGTVISKKNTYRSHNKPFIRLDVYEKQDDGTLKSIPKPQTYFNEAKLTAIALSIRFALLDLVSIGNGRFLALDDMLISLDMSNRTKVIDFLLSISDKYKIYLFTHDLNFYDLVRKKIDKELRSKNDWVIGKLFMNDFDDIPFPEFMPEHNKIDKAYKHLLKHDYPACGIYLRRECEDILKRILPIGLKQKVEKDQDGNDTTSELSLNDKILNLEVFCQTEDIDFTPFKSIKTYKDVILNTLAHNDNSSPIFRRELIALINSLKELEKLNRNEIILKSSKDPSIKLTVNGQDVIICIRTREPVLVIDNGVVKRISNYGKCAVTKIIENGIGKEASGMFDSFVHVYKHYCNIYTIEPSDDIHNITYYRGELLKVRIND